MWMMIMNWTRARTNRAFQRRGSMPVLASSSSSRNSSSRTAMKWLLSASNRLVGQPRRPDLGCNRPRSTFIPSARQTFRACSTALEGAFLKDRAGRGLAGLGIGGEDPDPVPFGVFADPEPAHPGNRRLALDDLAASALHGVQCIFHRVHAHGERGLRVVAASLEEGAVDARGGVASSGQSVVAGRARIPLEPPTKDGGVELLGSVRVVYRDLEMGRSGRHVGLLLMVGGATLQGTDPPSNLLGPVGCC